MPQFRAMHALMRLNFLSARGDAEPAAVAIRGDIDSASEDICLLLDKASRN